MSRTSNTFIVYSATIGVFVPVAAACSSSTFATRPWLRSASDMPRVAGFCTSVKIVVKSDEGRPAPKSQSFAIGDSFRHLLKRIPGPARLQGRRFTRKSERLVIVKIDVIEQVRID